MNSYSLRKWEGGKSVLAFPELAGSVVALLQANDASRMVK